MDYLDALRWLHTLPDFERTGAFAPRSDVGPILTLLRELGDPHAGRATVHVAGSKGKGSTVAMIEAVLGAAGLRAGCHVSPHLHRYTERIRVGGKPVAREGFAAAISAVHAAMDTVSPELHGREFVAFDALTAAAFVAFGEAACDAQVIEVGLGGALDPTNVFHGDAVRSDVAVMTPISLEHTAVLGGTIAEIAEQKAGIIARGCTVVVAPQRESALEVFRRVAAEREATIVEVASVCRLARDRADIDGQEFRLRTQRAEYAGRLPLMGRHQLENAATAIVACEELAARRGIEVTPAHVRAGLAQVSWPARLEVIKRAPLIVIDGAHNGDSAKRMVQALREDAGLRGATFVLGTFAGKDIAGMLSAVSPMALRVFAPVWGHARAASFEDIAEAARGALEPETPLLRHGSPADAIEAAIADGGRREPIVAFGSLAFAARVREYLLGIEFDIIDAAPGRGTG